MICLESFDAFNFEELKSHEDFDKRLQELLSISLSQCAEELSKSMESRIEELANDIANIAPYGDYAKLMENKEEFIQFLKEEAIKPENWKLSYSNVEQKKRQLIELTFDNKAVNGGDTLQGFVFIGLSGKIRHIFPQVNN